MQRSIAGYNILMLLSNVDGAFHPNEDLVIRNWLVQEFQFTKSFDDQLDIISTLQVEDFDSFLQKNMDEFYADSTVEQRNNLMQFAMNLIKADGVIDKGENKYFDHLFENWTEPTT